MIHNMLRPFIVKMSVLGYFHYISILQRRTYLYISLSYKLTIYSYLIRIRIYKLSHYTLLCITYTFHRSLTPMNYNTYIQLYIYLLYIIWYIFYIFLCIEKSSDIIFF